MLEPSLVMRGGLASRASAGRQHRIHELTIYVRIPAKASVDSEGNANGIPGRRRTVLGA